jgi:hypothetical protein
MTATNRSPEDILREAFATSAADGTGACSPDQQATLALTALIDAGYPLPELPAPSVDEATKHGVATVQFGQVAARVCEHDGSMLGIVVMGRSFDGPGAERLAAEILAARAWSDRKADTPA